MNTTEKVNEVLGKDIAETKKNDLLKVDPRNIVIEEGFNEREEYGDIEGLCQSIIEVGQLEAVKGYKMRGEEKYVLTDGHRRFRAIMMAKDGEAYRACANYLNVPEQGEVLNVPLNVDKEGNITGTNVSAMGYELPEQAPKGSPEVVKAVWGE